MTSPPLRTWTRYCVMDDFDDAMLSYALKEYFPNALFKPSRVLYREPTLGAQPTISECSQSAVDIWFPYDGWEPIFFPHDEYPDHFIVINSPQLYLHYRRTEWFWGSPVGERKWIFSLPMPESGCLSTGRWQWDDELKSFRTTIARIFRRLATNCLKDCFEAHETALPPAGRDRRFGTWVGEHVLEWCAQEPKRMANGRFRPRGGWAPRDTEWHQSIRSKVVDRFGENLGGPKKLEPRPSGGFFDAR